MSEFIRRDICEGVAFNSITDNRFKRGRISAALIVPLNRKTAAANALLSCVLTRSCKKYPDFTALGRKLNMLYGAALYPSVNRTGDFQIITITASGIDDKYALDGTSISSELTELLCSIIFEPNVVDGHFVDEDVEQERRQLIENIDAEFNDKRLYAVNRCIENMCRNEPFSIGRCGSREDVSALTHESIYSAWESLLKNARIELAMLGNTNPDKAYDGFAEYFKNKPRKLDGVSKIVSEVGEVKHIMETDEISQSKLVMGFRCAYPRNKKELVANSMMSAILGGIPTSKLFVNVREKQSLCYYCASMADNFKGIMLVDSGVETKNIEKTEKAVMEQINILMSGGISDDELNSARLAVKNAYISSLDNLASMQSFYMSGILRNDIMTPFEAAALTDEITKEDITGLAKQIKLDTVFSLIGNQ